MPAKIEHSVSGKPTAHDTSGHASDQDNAVYVFVYGTLRVGEANDIRDVARRHGFPEPRLVGTITVPGTLRDFGDYPGWVPDDKAATRVVGDVYDVAPNLILILDDIEEVYPGRPGLFTRTTLSLPCAGAMFLCMAYPVDPSAAAKQPVIESGDWVAHRRSRSARPNPTP